jgi:hypothetical protein
MPVNLLIIRVFVNLHRYYGKSFTVECPTKSGRHFTLLEIGEEIARRNLSIFWGEQDGKRPLYGGTEKFQRDPHWRDLILFHECFHGDNGAGIGASHQTDWTGIVSLLSILTSPAGRSTWIVDADPDDFFAAIAGVRNQG